MINYRKLVCLVISLQIFFVLAACGLASAEELEGTEKLPSLPLVLQGDLTVNGEPVSEGSEIRAYYEKAPIGDYKVEAEGKLNLILNLAPENYKNFENVEFYIDGAKAELDLQEADLEAIKNAEGISGPVIEVNARSSVVSPAGSGGSANSENAKEATPEVVNNEGTEGAESDEVLDDEKAASGQEGPVNAGSKGGVKYSDDQPVFWVVLTVAAILGAILVMRKVLVG
ncbi:MAG: hypothetical protein PHV51_04315 [Methanosarcinaceae archaeon]|nr:hypothetical protein [Methanosarcinaceae archaeon]MDD4497362.1 hypothetical protein [Methanosarcinaceae archaeon]